MPIAELKEARNINTAEIYPVDYKVLIKLDEVEEISAGGIVLTVGEATEREQMAQVRGTLIAQGGNAFQDWKGTRPEPGMRVMLAKYAGLFCEGYDGEEYRLCNDKDVAAILGHELRGPKNDR